MIITELEKAAARAALERMHMRVSLVDPNYAGMVADFRHLMTASNEDPEDREDAMMALRNQLCEAYGMGSASTDKNFAFANGVAIIPVHGTLINRYGGYYYGYITGYNFIRRQRAEAMADPDVTGIIYDINSNGGEVAGCFELVDESFELRGEKPTMAVVDSNCYSAAYAFASSADKIMVTPSGGAGSIGVIAMHVDMSKMLENWGINITLITSGDHKADGSPYAALPDDVKASIQAEVDETRAVFVKTVARNRNMDEKTVFDTQARCYGAREALNIGLIDGVMTPIQAFNDFISGSSDPSMSEDNSMSKVANGSGAGPATGAAAQGASSAVTTGADADQGNLPEQGQGTQATAQDERARIKAIQQCAEAEGRREMADHLAFETTMSVEDAKKLLAVAPKATPAMTQVQGTNAFAQAMDNADHPEVGADTDGQGESADKSDVNNLMSAFTMATGEKFN